MEARNEPSQENESLAGEVMESLGEPTESGEDLNESPSEREASQEDLPKGVKERIGRQERKHQRELRNMRAQLEAMQSRLSSQPNMESQSQGEIPYSGEPGMDEQIHKAIVAALRHKEMEEHRNKEAENAQHVNREYQELHKHLDDTADKYDDFDEVVRGDGVPFTPHMRDAALLLPRNGPGSAGEVLYKLGQNPEELQRISKLHPFKQASELVKLSHALIKGSENKSSQPARPLGQIKSNPVTNNHVITDKTPVSELRKRMKSGWK